MFENLTHFPKIVHSAQWGNLGGHIDIVTSFNQLQAFMGLYPLLFGCVTIQTQVMSSVRHFALCLNDLNTAIEVSTPIQVYVQIDLLNSKQCMLQNCTILFMYIYTEQGYSLEFKSGSMQLAQNSVARCQPVTIGHLEMK